MKTIKILHFADFHLGSDFRSLGRKSVARRNDLKDTFLKIIKLCKTESIDILLAVGDIFDSWSIGEEYFQLVADGFAEIPNTTVIISAGNHDPLTPDSVYLRSNFWSDNIIILPTKFDSVVLESHQTEIWGAGFATPYVYNSLFGSIKPKQPDYIQLGSIHGTIGSNSISSEYNPISINQITASGLDYLALGHIHKPSGIQKAGSTSYAYPGCPEGRGFDELGLHGILMGEVGKNLVNLEFVPLSKRRYLETTVDITETSGTKKATEKIMSQLKNQFGEHFENNLYKIYLEGKVDDSINIENIKTFLSDLFYVKLRDRTEINIDLEAASKEISLKGIFVKRMLKELELSDSPELKEALKLGLKAFSGKVDYNED